MTRGRLAALAALCVVGGLCCGDDPVRIEVFARPLTTVRIAGEPRAYYDEIVGSSQLGSLEIEVEALIEGRVSDRATATFDCSTCFDSSWDRVSVSFCAFESGELRFAAITCRGPNGVCTGDGFCLGGCGVCGVGEKCGLARVPWSPEHGWLACAPVGIKVNGEECSIDADGFDDCVSAHH